MAKNWNAEDTAFIEKEIQKPTMSNQELAEKLGRSLQSIAAKKRSVEEKIRMEKKGHWTAEEDSLLLAIPLKSEDDLARELHRDKKDVHARREQLVKQRMAEKERKAKELAEQAEKNKRVPLEAYSTKLMIAEMPHEPTIPCANANMIPEHAVQEYSALGKKLSAIRSAVAMLRGQSAVQSVQAVSDFLLLADYILSDN